MDWEDFDKFKEENFFVAFVNITTVEIGNGGGNNSFAGGSCSQGTKGQNCMPMLGSYMKSGMMEMLARNQKSRLKGLDPKRQENELFLLS